MKLKFSRHISEKYSNIKFHENPSSGSRAVFCGRTDRQTDSRDETNIHFLKCGKSALKWTCYLEVRLSIDIYTSPAVPDSFSCLVSF
jgi:hypothetical protein